MEANWLFELFLGLGVAGIILPLFFAVISSVRRMDWFYGYLIILLVLFVELLISSLIAYYVFTGSMVFLWEGRLLLDGYGAIVLLFISLLGFLIYINSFDFSKAVPSPESFSSIFMLAYLGSSLIALSGSISLFFISWIMTSIASYVLVGIDKKKLSSDLSLKYALLGSLSSVFLVLWLSTGTYFNGDVLWKGVNSFVYSPAVMIGGFFLLVGAGFKMGAVPFHWWLPDVYSGSDGRIISFITSIVKMGVITGFVRMLSYSIMGKDIGLLLLALAVVSVLSMTFGNIAALSTNVFSKIMAYSSIAHIGYILVGVAGLLYLLDSGETYLAALASSAVVVHIISYSLAKPIVFTISALLGQSEKVSRIKGLWNSRPLLGFSLFIALLSLLGVPPLLGFWGKLYLFRAGLSYSYVLVLIAIINSGISSYYYGRIIREIFAKGPEQSIREDTSVSDNVLFAFSLLLILLGLGGIQVLYPFIHMMLP